MRLKRKSTPKIDNAEDGARAQLIEESLAAYIFQYSLQLNYYESMQSVDYTLLKSISAFVRGYEVEACPLWQWEKAILDGFAIFRKLRLHRRGVITVDLNTRSISFKELPS
jgi:hypothetical protein